ncbi:MAG: RidA family protein [Gemmatimonadetes bacterium]|nr:RidA family protein [Gemmatimonadota bacterium]
MPRKALSSPTASAIGPYSHAVDDGTHVFCSGQTPIDPETGRLKEGGVGDQPHQCFDNLFAVLADGGLTAGDVVKVNVYLTDMDDFAEMNEAYATRFERPPPARTTVGVAALPMNARVEIELVAKKSRHDR